MSNEYNPGFAFYKQYYTAIENLPIEMQKEICYALVKYGITGEIVDSAEMPLGNSFAKNNKMSIDNSVKRWNVNKTKATHKKDNIEAENYEIAMIIYDARKNGGNIKSSEISDILQSKGIKISSDTIRKRAPWKDRDNMSLNDWCEKWIGENCENSQNNSQEL